MDEWENQVEERQVKRLLEVMQVRHDAGLDYRVGSRNYSVVLFTT